MSSISYGKKIDIHVPIQERDLTNSTHASELLESHTASFHSLHLPLASFFLSLSTFISWVVLWLKAGCGMKQPKLQLLPSVEFQNRLHLDYRSDRFRTSLKEPFIYSKMNSVSTYPSRISTSLHCIWTQVTHSSCLFLGGSLVWRGVKSLLLARMGLLRRLYLENKKKDNGPWIDVGRNWKEKMMDDARLGWEWLEGLLTTILSVLPRCVLLEIGTRLGVHSSLDTSYFLRVG